MTARRLLVVLGFGALFVPQVHAQTAGTLYTFPSGTSDWFKNFGTGLATLSNSGAGELQITETSATAGTGAAFTDGFNTDRESHGSGSAGGADLTGLSSLQFDIGHNGTGPVNVQFFTQATPGSNFISLGPDVAVQPGMNTYTLPLSGLTSDQIAYMRTVGVNIRDHTTEGNLTWKIGEVRSVGPSPTQRVIADHNGGATDFDGIIANFDAGAIAGGNGGQNNSGMSVVGGAVEWTDLGGSAGAAVTWGDGTQNAGGSFNARPVDLSNYDSVTVRMAATGNDPTVFVQFYMQTGSGFSFQSINVGDLPVDGQFHDLVIPLSSILNRDFVDTNGINLGAHANNLLIQVDSVIYNQVPEPASMLLLAAMGGIGLLRRSRA
jgi:hypothetical protein